MDGITISDGLLIAATIAGPVLAVQAQKFIERFSESRRRKLHIFYTLMSTRATRIANEHVQALNLIELEFNKGWYRKRSKEQAIIDAWRLHLDNLNQPADENDPASVKTWSDRTEGSFVELMYSMSQALGFDFDFDRVQLKRGMYYSSGQAELELAQRAVVHSLAKVLTGQQPIGMNVVGFPIDKQAAELQEKVQQQYLKALTGEGALHVTTKNDKKPR
jgi:hypothetical protein